MLMHAKTMKKGIIERLSSLGLSISYTRVLELSTVLGNDVLHRYEGHKVGCPRSLRKNVFTTAAVENIDHNPSSTSADITPIIVYNRIPPISDNYTTLQSDETFPTGVEIDKDQRYILK